MQTLEEKQASFRNLLIIALADGFLEQEEKAVMLKQAEEMGLRQEEVSSILQSTDELHFFIPKEQEAREKELKKLILMMLANGQISPSEYERCLEFATKANIPREQLDDWIDLFLDKENEYHRILRMNIKEYNTLFDLVLKMKIEKKELTNIIKQTAEHRLPDFDTYSSSDRDTLVRFLWLIFVRALYLDNRCLNQIPMYCDLIREGRYEWSHFFSALILNEKSNCNSPVHLINRDSGELLEDLRKFWLSS